MPKGKADKIDLSHLSFEEAVKRAWEAEPPPKGGMSAEEMRQSVDEDLEHIPTGARGSAQRLLRADYNMVRQNDLKRNRLTPRTVSLASALESVKQAHPDGEIEYDREWFESDDLSDAYRTSLGAQ